MGIIVNLDVMMAKRKMSLTDLAAEVDITLANLSILKNNKAKAVILNPKHIAAVKATATIFFFLLELFSTTHIDKFCDEILR